jgi:hypothetical protein
MDGILPQMEKFVKGEYWKFVMFILKVKYWDLTRFEKYDMIYVGIVDEILEYENRKD